MYKIKNIMSKLIIVFSIITMLLNGKSYATEVIREENGKATVVVTVEDAGNAIANFARNFNSSYGDKTKYDISNSYYESNDPLDTYYFNNTGFLEFVTHQSLGNGKNNSIDRSDIQIIADASVGGYFLGNAYEIIISSNSISSAIEKEKVKSNVMPGDILLEADENNSKTYNIAIYVGGDIIYAAPGSDDTALYQNSLYPEDEVTDEGKNRIIFKNYCGIARIKEEYANKLVASEVTTLFMQNDDDDKYKKYYGTTEGRYVGSYGINIGDWLFNGFVGFLDYLVGILFYIVKMPFLGWASIVENWINDTINLISGISLTDISDVQVPGYTPDANAVRLLKRINVEDLIYNNVPLLDIDIFDVEFTKYQNGYITIDENSILYRLKDNIVAWYFGIRNISIVGMLLVLIYLGIRLAISVTGEKKSKYKQMLVAWVSQFIAIFFIHYFMLITIESNNVLINWFKDQNLSFTNGLSLYETIRTRAYAVKISESLPASVMYIILVYFLIKFLYVYIRRYFTVNILALMAPIMCIKNATDKISKGKSGTMSAWMYDFALNVLIQSVHAIIYTVYMSQAYTLSTQSVAGFVLALIFMNFIFKAEDLFIKIFRFDDAKSLKDVKNGKNYISDGFKAAVGIGYYSIGATRFGFGFIKNTTKFIDFANQGMLQIGADIINKASGGKFDVDIAELREQQDTQHREMLNDMLENITGQRSLRLDLENLKKSDPVLYKNAKNALDNNRKLRLTTYSRSLKNGANSVKNMFALLTGTATMVIDPKVGITAFATTLINIGDSAKREKKYSHKTGKNIAGRIGSISANIATLGAFGTTINNIKLNNQQLKNVMTSEDQLNDIRNANTLQVEIERQTKEIEANIMPDDKNIFEDIKAKMIKESLDSVLYGKNIKYAVKNYMYKNNLTKINSSDIEGIMREFNLYGIENDINSLTKTQENKIDSLLEEINELKDVIKNAANEAMDDEATEKLKKTQDKLAKEEEKLEKTKKELDVIKQIQKELQKDPELQDGLYIDVKEAIREYKLTKQEEGKGYYYLVDDDINKVITQYKNGKYVEKKKIEEKFDKLESSKKKPKEQSVKKEKESVTNIFLDAIFESGNEDESIEKIKYKIEEKYKRNANTKTNVGKQNMFMAGKTEEIFDKNPEMYDIVRKMRELKTVNEKYINKYGSSIVNFKKYENKRNRRK